MQESGAGLSWGKQHWDVIWQAVKDVLLTGTGVILILSQVSSRTPSDVLLVTGLALTVPSVAGHARTLLGAQPGRRGPSSPPSPPSGPPSSSGTSSPEAGDDGA